MHLLYSQHLLPCGAHRGVLTSIYILFGSDFYYLQVSGTGMGAKMAPSFSDAQWLLNCTERPAHDKPACNPVLKLNWPSLHIVPVYGRKQQNGPLSLVTNQCYGLI